MQKKSIDATLALVVMALVIFGMIMISSVSVYDSFKITSSMVFKGKLDEASNAFYLSRNILHVIIGISLLALFSKISYTVYEKYSKFIFLFVIFLLFIVLIFGVKYNGAKGWIDIPLLPSLQPVEFAKIGLVIYLASILKRNRLLMKDFYKGFLPYFTISLSVFLFLAIQPDFGSILIIAPVVIALYFIGGGNIRYIIISLFICVLGAVSIYSIGKIGSSNQESRSKLNYISIRIDNFLQDSKTLFTRKDVEGKDYQIKQGLIAIGSGGFFGLGFGKSIQKFGYLPEVQGDFVFSVIVEELGFIGTACLLLAYLIIVYRGYSIARGVKDLFGKYLAFGISTLILVQVFVNIGVNLNIIPLTGVTLPFVSYGGSSLVSLMIAVGILLNISRSAQYIIDSSDAFGKKRRVVSSF